MHKKLFILGMLCSALLLVSVAGAEDMSFTLSGAGLDASGTFYAAPAGAGQWLVYDANGTFNGANITGIWPESNSGNIFSFNNLYYSPGPNVDWLGVVFTLDNGDMVNLCYDSGCAGAAGTYTAIVWDPVFGISNLNADSASFGEPVPEPGTLALLCAGLIAVSRFAQRRLSF